GIQGAVDVKTDDGRQVHSDGYRGNATTSLIIDDSLNSSGTSYTLTWNSVSASSPGGEPFFHATFGSAVVTSLEFHGGSGGNAVTLVDTMTSPSLQKVVLNTGLGPATGNIEKILTNVTLTGPDGPDPL